MSSCSKYEVFNQEYVAVKNLHNIISCEIFLGGLKHILPYLSKLQLYRRCKSYRIDIFFQSISLLNAASPYVIFQHLFCY